MRKDKDFEAQKEALMKEVRSVLQEVENLYDAGVESGTVEAKALKAKAQAQLGKVKSQFADFEAAASAKAHEAADRAREAAHYTAEKARGACRSTGSGQGNRSGIGARQPWQPAARVPIPGLATQLGRHCGAANQGTAQRARRDGGGHQIQR